MHAPARMIVATVLALLCACATDAPPPADAPAGADTHASPEGEWQLVRLGDMPMHEGIQPPTLAVAGRQVTGFAGVNRYTGARADEGEVLFGPLATTRMAGPPAAMELETRYLAALQQATGWRLEDGALVLLSGEATVLTFRPKRAD